MDQLATDIGSRLRQAREQRRLTLRDIAATTKISMPALVAIERNDFARLPGGMYRRAYVRSFATEVGLNADELAREYRARFETEAPAEPLVRYEADSNRLRLPERLPAVFVTIAGVGVCGLLLLGRSHTPHEALDGEGMPRAVEANLPLDTAQTEDSKSTPEIALANASIADIRAPSLRLEIRVEGLCWVSAMADRERVIYRLMQPGERALVEARSAITLRVGDAAAVAYSINGASGRPLGRSGEAVTVRITSENLESLHAEPSSPTPPNGVAMGIHRRAGDNVEANGQQA